MSGLDLLVPFHVLAKLGLKPIAVLSVYRRVHTMTSDGVEMLAAFRQAIGEIGGPGPVAMFDLLHPPAPAPEPDPELAAYLAEIAEWAKGEVPPIDVPLALVKPGRGMAPVVGPQGLPPPHPASVQSHAPGIMCFASTYSGVEPLGSTPPPLTQSGEVDVAHEPTPVSSREEQTDTPSSAAAWLSDAAESAKLGHIDWAIASARAALALLDASPTRRDTEQEYRLDLVHESDPEIEIVIIEEEEG